jgi:hypothetical protein
MKKPLALAGMPMLPLPKALLMTAMLSLKLAHPTKK